MTKEEIKAIVKRNKALAGQVPVRPVHRLPGAPQGIPTSTRLKGRK